MLMNSKIKVLIVEDSPVVAQILSEIINSDQDLSVIGMAKNGKEAVELVPELKPDIITMDIHMPVMDGYEAIKQIMAYHPTPIIVVTSSVLSGGTDKVFRVTSYGALDVINKDFLEITDTPESKKSIQNFIDKIKFLSKVKVITHILAKLERDKISNSLISKTKNMQKIVGIVTSTGGPQALQYILQKLPHGLNFPILIVQHISDGFAEGLAEWLRNTSLMNVKIAEHNEKINNNNIYIAPTGFQMKVAKDGIIKLTDDPPYYGFKPSGSVLLESIANVYGENAVGVILTGMGSDGTLGIKAIKNKGGSTLAQDEKTSVVFSMPKVAIEMGVVDKIVSLENMAEEIIKMVSDKG